MFAESMFAVETTHKVTTDKPEKQNNLNVMLCNFKTKQKLI